MNEWYAWPIVIGYAAIMVFVASFGVTSYVQAEHWMGCGANFKQAVELQWNYGSPNPIQCLMVEINTTPNP